MPNEETENNDNDGEKSSTDEFNDLIDEAVHPELDPEPEEAEDNDENS